MSAPGMCMCVVRGEGERGSCPCGPVQHLVRGERGGSCCPMCRCVVRGRVRGDPAHVDLSSTWYVVREEVGGVGQWRQEPLTMWTCQDAW